MKNTIQQEQQKIKTQQQPKMEMKEAHLKISCTNQTETQKTSKFTQMKKREFQMSSNSRSKPSTAKPHRTEANSRKPYTEESRRNPHQILKQQRNPQHKAPNLTYLDFEAMLVRSDDQVTAKREKALPLLKVSVSEPIMLKFQHCQKEETEQIRDQGEIKKKKKSNFFLSFFLWLSGNYVKEKKTVKRNLQNTNIYQSQTSWSGFPVSRVATPTHYTMLCYSLSSTFSFSSCFFFLPLSVEAVDAYLEVEQSERTKVTLSFLKSVKAKGICSFFRSRDLSLTLPTLPFFSGKRDTLPWDQNYPCNSFFQFLLQI